MQLSLHSEPVMPVSLIVLLEVAPESSTFSSATFAPLKEAFLVTCVCCFICPLAGDRNEVPYF